MKKGLVKRTSTGKFKVTIGKSVKPLLKYLLEECIQTYETGAILDMTWIENRVHKALIEEVYTKYFSELSIEKSDSVLLLTTSQALAFWWLGQEESDDAFANPELGQTLNELHQKLS